MKAVLFDLDNTLIMKQPTIPDEWHRVLSEGGFDVSVEDVHRAYAACEFWAGEQTLIENKSGVRMSDDEFLHGVINCCITHLKLPDSMKDLLIPAWIGDYQKQYMVLEGVYEVLQKLRERKLLLGIVSNNRASVRSVLEELKLSDYFSTIVISEEVGLYKPDPQILLLACERLGVTPAESVYIGDHPFDVLCAHEAHMRAAWIPFNEYMRLPQGVEEPEHRVNSLEELMPLL